tara:strand:- start:266 stop:505 length:240 start_codon:yes stop_codon:yes gene_type:complete
MVRSDSLVSAQKKYYLKNREKCITAMNKWRSNNKEKCRKYAREYYKNKKMGIVVGENGEKKMNGFSKITPDEPITLKFD